MGILGEQPFENDDAREWVEALDPGEGSAPVVALLRRTVEGTSDPNLDSRTALIALAGAELIAALRGKPGDALPRAARDWVASVATDKPEAAPDEEVLAMATRALDFVVTSSVLAELWSQSPDADRWRARLDDLRLRLSL